MDGVSVYKQVISRPEMSRPLHSPMGELFSPEITARLPPNGQTAASRDR
jgi:hypothetical protein